MVKEPSPKRDLTATLRKSSEISVVGLWISKGLAQVGRAISSP